jgi:small subunit ribosomal protein S21
MLLYSCLTILMKLELSQIVISLTSIFDHLSPTALSLTPKVKIVVGEGEPIESALRRFKREVNKSGHLMDLRHKRYFENSQDRKKRKIVQARIRKRLERMQARRLRQQRS